jgi:hypothetical protein
MALLCHPLCWGHVIANFQTVKEEFVKNHEKTETLNLS